MRGEGPIRGNPLILSILNTCDKYRFTATLKLSQHLIAQAGVTLSISGIARLRNTFHAGSKRLYVVEDSHLLGERVTRITQTPGFLKHPFRGNKRCKIS